MQNVAAKLATIFTDDQDVLLATNVRSCVAPSIVLDARLLAPFQTKT